MSELEITPEIEAHVADAIKTAVEQVEEKHKTEFDELKSTFDTRETKLKEELENLELSEAKDKDPDEPPPTEVGRTRAQILADIEKRKETEKAESDETARKTRDTDLNKRELDIAIKMAKVEHDLSDEAVTILSEAQSPAELERVLGVVTKLGGSTKGLLGNPKGGPVGDRPKGLDAIKSSLTDVNEWRGKGK